MTLADLPTLVSNLACAIAYLVLGALIIVQARRSLAGLWLAAAAFVTAAWAIAGALSVPPQIAGAFDLARLLAWYGFSLHLYRRAIDRADRLFTAIGGAGALCAIAVVLFGHAGLGGVVSLTTPAVMLRLALAISQLLLLENIYRGSPSGQRWHVGLACCTLGVLAAYEVVVCADAVLLRVASPVLLDGRPVVSLLVAPLLALAAARNRRWRIDIHVSRTAAFHSATLVVSGVFLMALAAVGELARQFGAYLGAGWGGLAEIYLVCAGILTVAILLTSGTARGALRRGLVDHFFTHRYDYRREWQNCIRILSAAGPLPERLIQALAAVVDSPSGLLFAHEPGQSGMAWAGAWKTAPCGPLSEPDARLMTAGGPLPLSAASLSPAWRAEHGDSSFEPWLAVPLFRPGAGEPQAREAMGCILLARPRTAFQLDAEVFDLLRILAHEVSIHLAQQQAAASLLQTRELRAYGERFAFVAHDIKNVSSQLSLLLANAETHLADPAFQMDMLATVRASVARISGLIRRLEPARDADATHVGLIAPSRLDVVARLTALLAARPRPSTPRPELDGGTGADGRMMVTMDASAFDAAVTHLLDNAAAAAGPSGVVRVRARAAAGRVIIEIIDNGGGMTPEFIRDELFRPFATRTEGGSGLGAFQARSLVRAAGGDVVVQSAPGRGTTMRLLLPRAVAEASAGATLAAMEA
jgi:putative PEP-CTERM system histidine kinase